MSAIEYSRKWEPFLGRRRSLPNDKNWKNLHDEYKSFHENNDVVITGHVVKIVRKEASYGSEVLYVYPGSFNCTIPHFMRLTASLGLAAKSWSASVIFVCPVHRKTEMAVFRRAAMT